MRNVGGGKNRNKKTTHFINPILLAHSVSKWAPLVSVCAMVEMMMMMMCEDEDDSPGSHVCASQAGCLKVVVQDQLKRIQTKATC